jgi:gliding motility-associated-like protein
VKKAYAQVSIEDSLVLVSLYNKIPALQADTTWLNGNVSTWSNVDVYDNRVNWLVIPALPINDSIPREICDLDALQYLSMNSCGLKGMVPACILEMPKVQVLAITANQLEGVEPGADLSKMAKIEAIFIINNKFSEMPDFPSITATNFHTLGVQNNDFNFDDLLSVLTDPPANYYYNVQHPVSGSQGFQLQVGDTFDFPDVAPLVGGTNNTYRWTAYDDSNYIPSRSRFSNSNTSILHLDGAQMEDNNSFICEVTNPNLPGLVLSTGIFFLTVTPDPLLAQNIVYQSDTLTGCGDPPLLLTATANGGRPVSFLSLNDSIATVNPDNTLSVHQQGIATIQASVAADTLYHGATKTIDITVTSHLTLPPFDITQQLPMDEGGDLSLSVPYTTGLTYEWTTPVGQTNNNSSLIVSPLTSSDLGTYTMRVTEGTCLHRSLSVSIHSLFSGKPVIYELITPNGDGDNETFYIKNLDPLVSNEVSVFNAVHQVVYHRQNYRNDWDGGGLPVGTYYYIVKMGEQTYKGNLYIKR